MHRWPFPKPLRDSKMTKLSILTRRMGNTLCMCLLRGSLLLWYGTTEWLVTVHTEVNIPKQTSIFFFIYTVSSLPHQHNVTLYFLFALSVNNPNNVKPSPPPVRIDVPRPETQLQPLRGALPMNQPANQPSVFGNGQMTASPCLKPMPPQPVIINSQVCHYL